MATTSSYLVVFPISSCKFSGKESIACFKGISKVTSTSEGSPCEETNNCYTAWNACADGDTS